MSTCTSARNSATSRMKTPATEPRLTSRKRAAWATLREVTTPMPLARATTATMAKAIAWASIRPRPPSSEERHPHSRPGCWLPPEAPAGRTAAVARRGQRLISTVEVARQMPLDAAAATAAFFFVGGGSQLDSRWYFTPISRSTGRSERRPRRRQRGVVADLVLVAHLDRVEVADLSDADAAEDAAAEVDLEIANDLAARRALSLGVQQGSTVSPMVPDIHCVGHRNSARRPCSRCHAVAARRPRRPTSARGSPTAAPAWAGAAWGTAPSRAFSSPVRSKQPRQHSLE